jgi:hypothetical protein
MLKNIFLLLAFLVSIAVNGQQIQFKVVFSKPYAVFEFMQSLSANARPNPYKKAFLASSFHTEKYNGLIRAFDSIPIDYSYHFRGYPPGKIDMSTESVLKKNLIVSKNMNEFKLFSFGLIPMNDLNQLVYLIDEFTPVYNRLIYEPLQTNFEKQLKDISELITTKKLAVYFQQAKHFYRAAWDSTVPFLFTFYPLPESKGFGATVFGNIASSSFPESLTNYNGMLTVLLHEISHVLYDEQPQAFKKQMREWIDASSSPYSHYASLLLNEAWATAVGNGFFGELLNGQPNPGTWYGWKYVSLMAKQIYPDVKEYMNAGKQIDKDFLDKYIQKHQAYFSGRDSALDHFLGTDMSIMSEDSSDFQAITRKQPMFATSDYVGTISQTSLEKFRGTTTNAKLIVVSKQNKSKLKMIQQQFPELRDVRFDPGQNFTRVKFLSDKTYLVIINLVTNNLAKQLAEPVVEWK